jgi:adenylyltransferase/sulfurtransferase
LKASSPRSNPIRIIIPAIAVFLVTSCQEAGVLGALAGTMGVLQATEAFKEILGVGDSLTDRLLLYDALEMRFREVKTRKDPNCPLCGLHPKVTTLMEYEASCRL